MENDLNLLKQILKKLHYTDLYIGVLLDNIREKFSDSNLKEITPNFLYMVLLPDEGKSKAKEISDYFNELKNTGNFETNILKLIKSKEFKDSD